MTTRREQRLIEAISVAVVASSLLIAAALVFLTTH
jgi:hypothetical protein